MQKELIYEGSNGVANRVVLTDLNGDPVEPSGGGGSGGLTNTELRATPVVVRIDTDDIVGQPAIVAVSGIDLLTGNGSGWLDVSGYHSASIQIVGGAGISAGAITFEQTNDTTAASAGNVWAVEEETSLKPTPQIAAITIAASTTRMFRGAVTAKYVRVRVSTTFVGGTVQAIACFSQQPFSRMVQTVAQASAANLAVTASIAATQTLETLTTLTGGAAAEDAATTSNPHIVGGIVRTGTAPTTLVAGDAARATMTSGAALVNKPFAVPEVDWQFTGALTTTTAAAAKAAGAAGIRNYVTGLQYQNTSATATTVLVLDGSTTIAQFNAPDNMALPAVVPFLTPLRGTAATALNVNCGTTGANVLINVQGYQAA